MSALAIHKLHEKTCPVVFTVPYLTTLEVLLFSFQTVGTASATAEHFGNRVGDLLHGTLDAVHSGNKIQTARATETS